MAHGFQARLDEMLHSRQVQLRRLNEETQLQASKRALLADRKSALRRIQQQVLLLRQKLAQANVGVSILEDDLVAKKSRIEQLATAKRDVEAEILALERSSGAQEQVSKRQMIEMEKFRAEVEAHVAGALEERRMLRENADEMELVLRTMRAEGEAAARGGLELARRREALGVQVGANLATKSSLQEQMEVAKRSLLQLELSAKERADDVRSLQVDNEQAEHEILQMLR